MPTYADIEVVLPFYTDPVGREFLGGAVSDTVGIARIGEGIRLWDERDFGPWVVADQAGVVVGWGGLSPYCGGPGVEVSYQVKPSRWREGYGRASWITAFGMRSSAWG